MNKRHLKKTYLYLLPSSLGTTLFYTAPFFVMLIFALGGKNDIIELGKNHAFSVGAQNTIVFLACGIGSALLLGMCVSLVATKFFDKTHNADTVDDSFRRRSGNLARANSARKFSCVNPIAGMESHRNQRCVVLCCPQ